MDVARTTAHSSPEVVAPRLLRTFVIGLVACVVAVFGAYLWLLTSSVVQSQIAQRMADVSRVLDIGRRVYEYADKVAAYAAADTSTPLAAPPHGGAGPRLDVPQSVTTHRFVYLMPSGASVTPAQLMLGWRIAGLDAIVWPQRPAILTTIYMNNDRSFAVVIPGADGSAPALSFEAVRALYDDVVETIKNTPPQQGLSFTRPRAGEANSDIWYVPRAVLGEATAGLVIVAVSSRQIWAEARMPPERIDYFSVYAADGRPMVVGQAVQGLKPRFDDPERATAYRFERGMLVISHRTETNAFNVVVAIPLAELLAPYAWRISLSILAMMCALASIFWLRRRMTRDVLLPSAMRVRQLQDSEEFVKEMVRAAPAGLAVFRSADMAAILTNARAQSILDRPVADVPGSPLLREMLTRCDGKPFPQELRITLPQGETCDLLINATTTRYRGAEALLLAFTDITQKKKAEAAMAAASAAADEARKVAEHARQAADLANAAKSSFLSTVTHEIRTPLHGMLGTLELMSRHELPAAQAKRLAGAQMSARALFAVVNDVLDFSRIEAGELALDLAPFDPVELVEDVVGSYASLAHKKGIALQSSLQADLDVRLVGDATRIRQIVGNLVGNAIKFTPAGRVFVRLGIVLYEADEGGRQRAALEIQVADSGVGIAPEDQARIFNAFEQVPTRDGVGQGTGLGLAICKRLAALMDGELYVASTPGLGSSFTLGVELPVDAQARPQDTLAGVVLVLRASVADVARNLESMLAARGALVAREGDPLPPGVLADACVLLISDDDEARPADHAYRAVVQLSGAPLFADPPPRHFEADPHSHASIIDAILRALGKAGATKAVAVDEAGALGLDVVVVDDVAVNRELLAEQLDYLGCTAILFKDGESLLQQQGNIAWDLAIIDVNLPGIDGYRLARALRERGAEQPILALSATAVATEARRAADAGMQGYLVKPLSLGQLRAALAGWQRASPRPRFDKPLPDPASWRSVFFESAAVDWRALLTAYGAGDLRRVADLSHRLKGGFGVVSMPEQSATFDEIERAAQDEDAARLHSLITRQRQALSRMLESQP
ncbi:ATP-binding protein [Uliginosibacterium sp. sgz301328]|uniref:hybrid sensor histidine kinase/response regulator n=1 Tax=Uliginosibacterium sp. sgz301328 TaxID=3243764 RepID=UPI00359DFAA3